jgi:secreted protein with Ig-like and vWFA domain
MGDVVDRMQEQLGTLERLVVQTRSVARALHDMSGAGIAWDAATSDTVGQCLLVAGFAATRYGDYLDGQPDSQARLAGAFHQLDEELQKVTAALAADAEREPARWDANGSVQTSLRRFLEELRSQVREEKSATGEG